MATPQSSRALRPPAAPAARSSDEHAGDVEHRSSGDPSRHWTGAPPAAADDALIGTTLNQSYEIVGVLAEGGMGRVYEARHTRIPGKRLTVKVLHEEFVRRPESVERFQREAEAAAAVPSPYVIRVYDVHRTPDGRPFLVAEYLDGVELGEHLDVVGKLSVPVAVRIARQLCKGLGAAHAAGVVHRDMKPENVFLTGDLARPVAKILDFGISRLAHKTGSRLTQTGVIMGTPAYMSPEQACGHDVDHRTDVYAVGAILYTCLTGRAPFEQQDPTATILAVATEEPPRPRSIDPSLPDHLEMVVQRAMARNVADRFATAAELDAALAPFEVDDPIQVVSPADAGDAAHARGKLALYLMLAFVVLLGVFASAVAGLFAALRGGTIEALPSRIEMLLVLVALAGSFVTPSVLYARYLRRRVWNNTAAVLERLGRVRAALFAGLGSYGFSALCVGVFDVVIAPPASAAAPAAFGIGWPVWWSVLAGIGALAAGASFAARSGRMRVGFQRVIGSLAAASCLALLGLGFVLREPLAARGERSEGADGADPTAADAPSPAVSGDPEPSASGANAAPSAVASPAWPATAPSGGPASSARAAPGEIAAARDESALAALAERYPDDPAVLSALMQLYGKKSDYRRAMDVASRLFSLSPDAAGDRRLRLVLAAAAQDKNTETSAVAYQLMKTRMGEHGPDLLYDLLIESPSERERADLALAEPEVKRHMSAALAVSYALRSATSCPARLPLLARAASDGDLRTLSILALLAEGQRSGCGPRNLRPCPAMCPALAGEIHRTMDVIRRRLGQR